MLIDEAHTTLRAERMFSVCELCVCVCVFSLKRALCVEASGIEVVVVVE